MNVSLDSVRQAEAKARVWLIPVFEKQLKVAAEEFGFDAREANAWGFSGADGQSQLMSLSRRGYKAVLLGAGAAEELTTERVRNLIATGLRHPATQRIKAAAGLFAATGLSGHGLDNADIAEACAEGAVLAGYAFTRLKGKGTDAKDLPSTPRRLIVACARVRQVDRRRFREGLIMGKWTNWARELLNQSQSQITASVLAARARSAAKPLAKVQCRIMGKKDIATAKMGLLLAVNQGSTEAPRFIVLRYGGAGASTRPVCLVGKGLTYDTGGYNLKPGDSMKGMHMDKGGGVGVLASFFAAAEMRVKRNLVCLVPCTDNRVSGSAMVPGDVFSGLAGISVEIDNTDAEGRLVLADALAYSARFKPSHILDMATLTGAAVVAVGDRASAIFCNDELLCEQLLASAQDAGELVWRLPLWSEYESKLNSFAADIRNVGGRWGGAITAALFLQRFVPAKTPWCHIDMAGKMKAESEQPDTPAGCAYGFGPRLVGRWLRSLR